MRLLSKQQLTVIVLGLLLLVAPFAGAQLSGKGAISGRVTDATGAAIPNAVVTITNDGTNASVTVKSTGAGDYNAVVLDPGVYTVTTTATGFSKLVQQHVQVNALETQTYNPSLSIGGAAESVTVSSAPPQLETTNATLGATMESEMYSALPIQMGAGGQPDQRRATDFAALMPGVQSNTTGNANATTSTGIVNGSGPKGGASAVYIDGVPFTMAAGEGDPRFVWTAISVDAVDQFQVQTSGYSALYEGQGVQNYVIKQGGNKFHGAVYEFFRNTALDTWGFFAPGQVNPATGKASKPVEHQNEFGIYLSGPVWKDKIFVFGNYDAFRYSRVSPTYNTFPNLAEQAGNFAGILPIYDPNTQTACTAFYGTQCRYRYGYTHGASTSAAQILSGAPVDVIPAAELSPIALAMQRNIPALTNQNVQNNYIAANASGLTNFSTTNRIDWIISPKNTLTLVGADGRQASSVPVGQTTSGRNVANLPFNYSQAYAPKTVAAIIEDTYVLSSRVVNQFKYGFARYDAPTINADYTPAYSAAAEGIGGLPAGQAAGAFPITTFSGTDAVTQWAGTTAGRNTTNSYALLDNVQLTIGKHSFTFGGDIAWLQLQYNTATGGTTPLTLANSQTETAGINAAGNAILPSTGLAYASFLVGQIDSASLTQNNVQETGARFRPISPYVQDNWKVTSKLTLDLGVRYDFFPTYREAHNILSFFNPSLTNPVTGSPGALQFAGTGTNTCGCNTPVQSYYKNIGPRIGFAYQTDPKTVFRGSYAVMYTHGNGIGGSAISRNGTGTLGFSASPKFSSNTSTFLSTAPLGPGSTSLPAYAPAAGVASGAAYGTGYTTTTGYTGTPSTISYGDPYLGGRAPQFINYTLGFQHQWTPTFTTSVSYVGSQGHFLSPDGSNARGYYADQLDPQYLSLGANLTAAASKAPGGYATYAGANGLPYYSWFNTTQALSQALKPFPQYAVSDVYGNVSNENYNALQITMMKRPSRGFTVMANYTWSRSIDDLGTFRTGYALPAAYSNSGRAWKADAVERTVSAGNQPHHAVVTGVWNLPFGAGRLGGQHFVTRALLGGYKFSTIVQLASGSPLAIIGSACQTNPAQSTCAPTLNPGFSGTARIGQRWGKGVTATNTAVNFITPSVGSTTTSPSGPFVNPTPPTGQVTLLNTAYAPAFTFGNAPRTAPYGLTGPGSFDLDISLRRSFNLHMGESSRLSLQADMYNVTNYTQFGGVGVTVGSSNFGQVSSQTNSSRDVQLSGRIEF